MENRSKWTRMVYWTSWIIYGVILLLSVRMCTLADPIRENLTGIGWIHGEPGWMSLYVLMAGALNGALSFFCLKKYGFYKQSRILLFAWGLGSIGALFPYVSQSALVWEIVLSSLHQFLCNAAFVIIAAVWLYLFVFASYIKPLRKISGTILFLVLCSMALIGLEGCVNTFSEVLFLSASPLVFLLACKRA